MCIVTNWWNSLKTIRNVPSMNRYLETKHSSSNLLPTNIKALQSSHTKASEKKSSSPALFDLQQQSIHRFLVYGTHQLNGTRVIFPWGPMLTFGLAKRTKIIPLALEPALEKKYRDIRRHSGFFSDIFFSKIPPRASELSTRSHSTGHPFSPISAHVKGVRGEINNC
jgi:hypothetical protein